MSPVLVMRCDEGEAAVPSRVVVCVACGADCWLSLYSGEQTLEVGRRTGDPRIMCRPCLEAELGLEL